MAKSNNPKKKKKSHAAPEDPRKEKEFKLYVLWKSLPPLLRNELEKKPELWKNTGFGDNPVIEKLLQLKTQKEFAAFAGVGQETLSEWNKTIENRDLLADFRKWAKHLSHNLVMAMYNKAVKYGDPYRIELWFKLVHGWNEKLEIEHNVGDTLADIMKKGLKQKRDAAAKAKK